MGSGETECDITVLGNAGVMINGQPDQGQDFFEQNPALRYVPEFAELIDKVGEARAGKLVWAVWLILHPDSGIRDMPEPVKREWVAEKYLGDAGFDWGQLEAVEERFPEVAMTVYARSYYDALSIHESSVRMAKSMNPKDQSTFVSGLARALAALEKVEERYVKAREKGVDKAAGEVQSGWAAGKKRGV